MVPKIFLCIAVALITSGINPGVNPWWGFFTHKMINRLAVFTLPPEMLKFYKYHIHIITNLAVQADRRRYALEDEAPRHYIDLDYYGLEVPRDWASAMELYPKDSLQHHGVLPWHLPRIKYRLTAAFQEGNSEAILRISADAAHYIADAHVPLHTTSNYNGQLTDQHGIHGFWETRVPELLWAQFDLWVGRAEYWQNFTQGIWDIVWESHRGVDSVLTLEKELTDHLGAAEKYSYETRNRQMVRTYSKKFTQKYYYALNGQVASRLKQAIRRVGDFWYTCWVDAGQPPLTELANEHDFKTVKWQDSLWRTTPDACHYGRQ